MLSKVLQVSGNSVYKLYFLLTSVEKIIHFPFFFRINAIKEITARCPLAMTEDLLHDLVQYKTHKNKSKYYMDMTLNSFFLYYVVSSFSLHDSVVPIGFYGLGTIFSVWVTSVWSVYPWEIKQSRVAIARELIDKNKARKRIVKES